MSSRPRVLKSTVPYLPLVASGVLGLMLVGCGGSDFPTESEPPIALVTVSPENDTVWVGDATTFTVRAEDPQGNPVSGTDFIWTSSNPSVATVGPSGRHTQDVGPSGPHTHMSVSGVAEGVATITATAQGQSGTATVAVRTLQLTSVDPGTFVTCGLAPDGAAYCWGSNGSDILGVGPTDETCPTFAGIIPCSPRPLAVRGGLTFATLSVGNGFTCGLDKGGAAYCWGLNEGRLGTGDHLHRALPAAVVGGLTFTSVGTGGSHACGLTAAGAAYCWGANEYGQLGTAAVSDVCPTRTLTNTNEGPCSTTPVAVDGGLTFTSLAVPDAGWYTCGVIETGAAYCWGRNLFGELGNGVTTGDDPNPAPIAVSGGLNFASLSGGDFHTCGVTVSGEAYCWGLNRKGQLGNGTGDRADSTTPRLVSGGLVFRSVTAGDSYTCGIGTNDVAYCWGYNGEPTLGRETGDFNDPVPAAVAGGLLFASVSSSWFHTCGLTTGGVAYCWGDNEFGQIGNGQISLRNVRVPVRVVGHP